MDNKTVILASIATTLMALCVYLFADIIEFRILDFIIFMLKRFGFFTVISLCTSFAIFGSAKLIQDYRNGSNEKG